MVGKQRGTELFLKIAHISFLMRNLLFKGLKILSPSRALIDRDPTLVSIGYSHYCEKARFALDLSPLKESYREERHTPFFHLPYTLDLRKLPRHTPWLVTEDLLGTSAGEVSHSRLASKELTGVPKLIVHLADRGPVVVGEGSRGVLRFLAHQYPKECGFLYPKDIREAVIEMEDRLDSLLGQAASDWSFGNVFLPIDDCNKLSIDYFIRLSTEGAPPLEQFLFRILAKSSVVGVMTKANKISIERTVRAKQVILNEFKHLDEVFSKNKDKNENLLSMGAFRCKKYLMGTNHPTAADIALSALSIPLLMPDAAHHIFGSLEEIENFVVTNGNGDSQTAGLQRIIELTKQLRETQTGQMVLDIYRVHRHKQ